MTMTALNTPGTLARNHGTTITDQTSRAGRLVSISFAVPSGFPTILQLIFALSGHRLRKGPIIREALTRAVEAAPDPGIGVLDRIDDTDPSQPARHYWHRTNDEPHDSSTVRVLVDLPDDLIDRSLSVARALGLTLDEFTTVALTSYLPVIFAETLTGLVARTAQTTRRAVPVTPGVRRQVKVG